MKTTGVVAFLLAASASFATALPASYKIAPRVSGPVQPFFNSTPSVVSGQEGRANSSSPFPSNKTIT
ncbi:hypothetical protein ACJ41O_009600 [Fusarium nematophilum]